ncbi:ROK family protein [Mesoplasma seiffertii]|uniref:ROK family protein n=1 Tax=Mesoplasma seiffertii TaxID=28224 RepID=UPI00047D8C66|nr:ROK family protein [Mesoplasma seiffertii]
MLNITFDVGGTGIKVIVFEENKEIETKYLNHSNQMQIGENLMLKTPLIDVLKKISEVLDNVNEEFNLAISFPGIIDTKNKKVLAPSSIINVDEDLVAYFKKYKKLKNFVIANDAKAAVIGEYQERIKKDQSITNMVHLTIGTALGAGIIINKEVVEGKSFQAGEIGKMYSSLEKNNPSVVAIDTGMGTLLLKYWLETQTKISGEEFFELFNNHNQLAVEMMDDFTSHIAKLIINLDYMLDIDLITIGGGVSANPQFIKMIKNKITKHKDFYWNETIVYSNHHIEGKFDESILKNKAACYGGLYLLNKEKEKNA